MGGGSKWDVDDAPTVVRYPKGAVAEELPEIGDPERPICINYGSDAEGAAATVAELEQVLTRWAAVVTSLVMVVFSGQPAVVRSIPTTTSPPSTSTERTMPSSVMGRRISGSITFSSSVRIASTVGALMPPW